MRYLEIPEANKSFNIPENLSECSGKEYMAVSRIIMLYFSGAVTYEQMRILVIEKLLNIQVDEKCKEDEEIMSNIYMLSEIVDSYFEDEDGQKKVLLNFIDIKIKKIRTILKTYHGPEDNFNDMTYGEYTDAVKVFLQFSNSGDVSLLYDLAAIFYRLKNRKGREPYSSDDIEKRAKIFKKYTSLGFVSGVYLQFAAFMQYLPDAMISLDGRNDLDFSILYDSDSEESPEKVPGIGADAVVFSLAETGVFGNVKEVRNTRFWEIQIALYELRRKDLENQKLYNNAKSESTT